LALKIIFIFLKIKYLQFYDICGYKNGRKIKNISPSSFGAVVRSGILDKHQIYIYDVFSLFIIVNGVTV
jgi:hypothetical protein